MRLGNPASQPRIYTLEYTVQAEPQPRIYLYCAKINAEGEGESSLLN